jgi:hypothetical protein
MYVNCTHYFTGVSANSDPSADYHLQPSSKEYSIASGKWKEGHSKNDVPLFRIPSKLRYKNTYASTNNSLFRPFFRH